MTIWQRFRLWLHDQWHDGPRRYRGCNLCAVRDFRTACEEYLWADACGVDRSDAWRERRTFR